MLPIPQRAQMQIAPKGFPQSANVIYNQQPQQIQARPPPEKAKRARKTKKVQPAAATAGPAVGQAQQQYLTQQQQQPQQQQQQQPQQGLMGKHVYPMPMNIPQGYQVASGGSVSGPGGGVSTVAGGIGISGGNVSGSLTEGQLNPSSYFSSLANMSQQSQPSSGIMTVNAKAQQQSAAQLQGKKLVSIPFGGSGNLPQQFSRFGLNFSPSLQQAQVRQQQQQQQQQQNQQQQQQQQQQNQAPHAK